MFSKQEVAQKRKGFSAVIRHALNPRLQPGSYGQFEDTANHIHYTFSEWQTVKSLGAAMREKLLSLLVNYPLRINELLRLSIKQFIALENMAVLELYQQAQSAHLDGGALLKEILEYSPENILLLERLARPSVQQAVIRGIMSIRDVASLPDLTDAEERHIRHAVEKYDRLRPRKGFHLPRFGSPPTFMKIVQKMGFNELRNPSRTTRSEPMCPFITERIACVTILDGVRRITVPETHWGKYNALTDNDRYSVDWLVETYRIPYERSISLVSERCDLDGTTVNVENVMTSRAVGWITSGRAFFDEVLLTGGYERHILTTPPQPPCANLAQRPEQASPRHPVQQKPARTTFARSSYNPEADAQNRARQKVNSLMDSLKISSQTRKRTRDSDSFSSGDESDTGSMTWDAFQASQAMQSKTKRWERPSSIASTQASSSSRECLVSDNTHEKGRARTDVSSQKSMTWDEYQTTVKKQKKVQAWTKEVTRASDRVADPGWEPFKPPRISHHPKDKAKKSSVDPILPGMMPSRTVYTHKPKKPCLQPIDDSFIGQIFDPLPQGGSPIFQAHAQPCSPRSPEREARRQKRLAQLEELRAQRIFDKEHQTSSMNQGRGDDTMGTDFKKRLEERTKAFSFAEQRAATTTYHREAGMSRAESSASLHRAGAVFSEEDMAEFDVAASGQGQSGAHRSQRAGSPDRGGCNPCEPDFTANPPSMLYSKTGQYGYAEALSKKLANGATKTVQTMEDAQRRVQNIVTSLNDSTVMSTLEEREAADGGPSTIHYRQVTADQAGFSYAQHTQCGSCVTEARFVTRGVTAGDAQTRGRLRQEFQREVDLDDDRTFARPTGFA